MKKLYAFAGTAMCCSLLILTTYSAHAQNSWSRGVLNLTVTKQEGMQRITSAFEAEAFIVHISGEDYIAAKKRNHSAVITCNDACDGKTVINLFVTSTAYDSNEPAILREKLQAQIAKSPPSTTNPYVTKPPAKTTPDAIKAIWTTQANDLRGKNGERFTYYFPPEGAISGRLWGTDIYTDDSSIATAAVHAGLISTQTGGTVTIEIMPGQPSYTGSGRNGVNSNAYGGWGGSFSFVK